MWVHASESMGSMLIIIYRHWPHRQQKKTGVYGGYGPEPSSTLFSFADDAGSGPEPSQTQVFLLIMCSMSINDQHRLATSTLSTEHPE